MKFYRIDHIAQVTPSLAEHVAIWESVFGFRRISVWDNPQEGCQGVRLGIPGNWGQVWEVLTPFGDDSILQSYLDSHGGRPGLHHVAVQVPDMEIAVEQLTAHGIDLSKRSTEGWIEASLSPPGEGPGVLFRLQGPGHLAFCGDGWSGSLEEPHGQNAVPSLGIVAIDHVCQASYDRDKLSQWYQNLAGFSEIWRTPDGKHPDMADLVLNIPGSNICWEVIMPWGEDSFIERFLTKNGSAAHHVTFEVRDWDRALAACRYHGIPTFDDDEGVTDGALWRHTFIHPKYTGGILVQLFWEEKPGVWVRSDKIPSSEGIMR